MKILLLGSESEFESSALAEEALNTGQRKALGRVFKFLHVSCTFDVQKSPKDPASVALPLF